MADSSKTDLDGGYRNPYIYDNLYLFSLFILPFLGYVSSIIYRSKEGSEWYEKIKFQLVDLISNSTSYSLFFTLFIYMFTGMGIVFIANFYLGINDLSAETVTNRITKRIRGPLLNLNKFWDSLMLMMIPISLFLLWISTPLMYQYKSLMIPQVLSLISTILFVVVAFYMIKIHWIIMLLFIPICIWCIYLTAFYFTGVPNEAVQQTESGQQEESPESSKPNE